MLQVVQRFQELFAQTKYKEAAELAAESPQGILRTPDTVAKFQVYVPYSSKESSVNMLSIMYVCNTSLKLQHHTLQFCRVFLYKQGKLLHCYSILGPF